MNQAIQLAPAAAPLALSSDQESLIRDMYGNGASETEFQVFLEVCRARRLNPLTRQIYFVQRWDSDKGRQVWAAQVSIDGFRAIAERTGKYDGQDEPEYEYDAKGKLLLAKVRVYRKDWTRPAVGVARFDEYAAKKKDGGLTFMWASKGHVMIAKCAEALALRKAFPEDLSGLYVPEEMDEHAQAPRRGTSAAHAIVGDNAAYDASKSPFPELKKRLDDLDAQIAVVATYDAVNHLRGQLGSKAHPSQLNREIQAAVEAQLLSGDEFKELGRMWQRCNRALTKKETDLRPPVEASFVDEPEQPAAERQPGEEG